MENDIQPSADVSFDDSEEAIERYLSQHATEREIYLLSAISSYRNGLDMMLDGPDDSDVAYAKARLREADKTVRDYIRILSAL